MKAVFAGILVLLLILTGYATWLQRPEDHGDKSPLVWVSDDNPVRQGQIALFNQLHPESDLRLDPGNRGMEKVIVQSLAGVGPDLFDCYDGFQLSAFVKSGIALDVTDELAQVGVHPLEDVWPAVFPNILHEGKVYGFPTNAAVDAMWFNKDIFDSEGLPYPSGVMTWDELIELAKRLTKVRPDGRVEQFGLLCDWRQWQQFVIQWGGSIYSADGTKCTLDSPEAIAGVKFLHDMIYVHHIMPSPVEEAAMAAQGGWGAGTIKYFQASKGAMAVGGRWWLCTLRDADSLRLGAFPCPDGPKHVYRGYGRATLVNAQGRNRRGAIEFLKYMAGQEYNDLVNHQADALAPVIKFCYTDNYLHDPAYPNEDFNQVWRGVMAKGQPDQISPFINGQRASRILNKQMDLVKNDQKSAKDALTTAAQQINEEIHKTLERDPSLRLRYQRLQQKGKL